MMTDHKHSFQLYEPSFYQDYGQTLSLILMASRFIMAANYCTFGP